MPIRLPHCLALLTLILVALLPAAGTQAEWRPPDDMVELIGRPASYLTGHRDRESAEPNAPFARARAVHVRTEGLRAPAAIKGQRIRFEMFTDAAFEGLVTKVRIKRPTRYSLRGHLVGAHQGTFTMVVHGDLVAADVRPRGGDLFQLRYLGLGVHEARQVSPSTMPEAEPLESDVIAPSESILSRSAAPPSPGAHVLPGTCDNDDPNPVIDLLVVYTREARENQGGVEPMELLVDLNEAFINESYDNSEIALTLNVVGPFEIDYQESGDHNLDLPRITNDDDGYMDEVHDWRNLLGADLVTLYVTNLGVGGVAWLSVNNPDYDTDPELEVRPHLGFNVVKTSLSDAPFAHEIGHNLGCHHDFITEPVGNGGAFPFSRGYDMPGAPYKTIMSYRGGATIPHYSNPDVSYEGYATGLDAQADNAQTINTTGTIVADYRTCIVCDEADMGGDIGTDCNGNGAPDLCEVYRGLLPDINSNGIPDSCESPADCTDCNGNSVCDQLELPLNDRLDCNHNGILDTCDLADGIGTDDDGDGYLDLCDIEHYYVNANAVGANNGSTWSNAFTDLSDALNRVVPFDPRPVEIWVASGTYTPDDGTLDRARAFWLGPMVEVYGGFAGDEAARDQRDPGAQPTVMSGDLLGNDGPNWSQMDDNSYHVVEVRDGASAVLDGFIVEGGRANGVSLDGNGAGVTASFAFLPNDVTFRNVSFSNNWADGLGGGIYAHDSVVRCEGCDFTDNRAYAGSAVTGQAGSSLSFINGLFAHNDAEDEGAILSDAAAIALTNCSLGSNAAPIYGGVLSINSGQASLANSILWGNGDGTLRGQAAGVNVSAEHSCVQGLPAVAGTNTGHNPLFVEGSFELTEGSPAIDTGDNAAVWPGVTTDLAGADRFVNATGLASAAVDMGAYEFAPAATPNQCELEPLLGIPYVKEADPSAQGPFRHISRRCDSERQ